MRSLLVGAVLSAVAATPALAQRVRGTLTDSSTHEPITGAVVTVSDSSGRFLARGIAGGDGRFDIPRFPGSKQIRIVRIGYRPIDATVPAGNEQLELEMRAIASQLAAVTTSGRRVCPGDDANSQALQLWEQARSGFLAAVVARDAHPPNLQLRYFRVERDPMVRRVVDDSIWSKTLVGDQPFVAARSATVFATEGYMRERAGGDRDYYAPDEAVLLDQAFAGAHCLRVSAADQAHPAEIGIGFEPVTPERDSLVEIRGTVWLDQKTLDLRTVDFEYTNLEPVKGGSGGSISFQSMPNGVPMIVRWTIHSPIIATDETEMSSGIRRSLPPRRDRHRYRVLGYQVLGAEARQVMWPDGAIWRPRLASITGVVVDLHGRPMPGMRVWLNGMSDTVVTDSAGLFRLPRPVIGGLFSVVAADSTLASGGINQTVPHTLVVSDERSPAADISVDVLKMYPRGDALKVQCPNNNYVEGQGVAILRVLDTAGVVARRAHVDMETLQTVVLGDTLTRAVHRQGEIDFTGAFIVCGASLQQPMAFHVSLGEEHGDAAISRWSENVMVLTLRLHTGSP
ncbi:MAG TPA: carboxypeptidase-like regulatory domain-containing protein [Gemmatimonadaceae bacterium]|nr:carboxypeptidase-like regulatory domain-containing protein [Gemmatimonadaceae bacterium]